MIECGFVFMFEFKWWRFYDSWGKKINWSFKGLMYMSLWEWFREKDYECKRGSGGVGVGGVGVGSSSNYSGGWGDFFFVEIVISEEFGINSDNLNGDCVMDFLWYIFVCDFSFWKMGFKCLSVWKLKCD